MATGPSSGSHLEPGPEGRSVEHPTAEDFGHARVMPKDRTWFKRAVFYEVLVRAFYDSDADGSGDLKGLIERLDYLEWLGVDCLWFAAGVRFAVARRRLRHSGLLQGAARVRHRRRFRRVARRRSCTEHRVIIDLVMNHTSDSHLWFQQSRSNPDGPYGDFYVWSDTSDRYPDARVIFVDTEESNWTFDPVRRQFYWHRFFSHQPDLNYDNPAVQEAMINVLRFWMDLGIDGFRLDAVPYLFERGHELREPPETHAFLRHCRKVIDDEYPGGFYLPRPISGPPTSWSISGCRDRRRRMPYGVPLSADAADLHGGAAGVAVPDLGDPRRHRRFPSWRSGESSCGITTN